MKAFKEFLDAGLAHAGWNPYDLVKYFEALPKEKRLSSQYVYALCRGDKEPKEREVVEKLAAVPQLGLELDDLLAWYGLKQVGEDAILKAVRELSPEQKRRLLAEIQGMEQ